MRVVEADQPLTVRPVQRQRVVDAVGFLRRHRHSRHDQPDPMTALGVHHENLPVQVEKHIEGRIARLRFSKRPPFTLDLAERFHDVHRQADRAAVVGDAAANRLADPPRRVRRKPQPA